MKTSGSLDPAKDNSLDPAKDKLENKPTQKLSIQKVSTLGGFIAGAVAACGAVTFTNPIELVKTRMQLQGELLEAARASIVYKNPFQALVLIFRTEGIRGLQQGLTAGYLYQIMLNGSRIGFYEPCRYYLTKLFLPSTLKDGHPPPQNMPINVCSGFISGGIGSVIANPFFLIKTRMQSYTKTSHVVGQQTHYKNVFEGISKIVRTEGLKGLFRGYDSAILRSGVGSSAQLPLYFLAKLELVKAKLIDGVSTTSNLICSSLAGLGVAVVMNPFDVVLTRVYNQKGNLYKGSIDCLAKTIRYEGFPALYKGFIAQTVRVAPHTILTLTFMEYCMLGVEMIERRFTS